MFNVMWAGLRTLDDRAAESVCWVSINVSARVSAEQQILLSVIPLLERLLFPSRSQTGYQLSRGGFSNPFDSTPLNPLPPHAPRMR